MISGCRGQVGVKLVDILSKELGPKQIIACDLHESSEGLSPCTYHQLNVCDKEKYEHIVKTHKVDTIIHLAAIISAIGEKNPHLAYDVNVNGATNALNIATQYNCGVFIPTSIAVFGGDAYQKDNSPLDSIL